MKKGKFFRPVVFVLLLALVSGMFAFPLNINADEATVITTVNRTVTAEDKTWYDNDPNATEFTITTAGQLAYLSELAQINNFSGKTIKLGNDIVWNNGVASEDGFVANGADPIYNWQPIGPNTSKVFSGTFDGQGHTISGLCMIKDGSNLGFFGVIKNSVIKNVRLSNIYYSMSGSYGGMIASQSWQKCTIDNVSVDNAYMMATPDSSKIIGGIIGSLAGNPNAISNCVFSGVISASSAVGGIVGMTRNGMTEANTVITNCVSYADIRVAKASGGVVGRACGGFTAVRSHFFGKITSTEPTSGQLAYLARIEQNEAAQTGVKNVVLTDCYYSDVADGALIPVTVSAESFEYSITTSYTTPVSGGTYTCNGTGDEAAIKALLSPMAGKTASSLSLTKPIGCQEGYLGESFTVRFIATLDNTTTARYAGYSIKILCDSGVKTLETNYCTGVYKSLLENGGASSMTAAEHNVPYLFALSVKGVPTEGAVTFIVTPFTAMVENDPVYGESMIATYINGGFGVVQ